MTINFSSKPPKSPGWYLWRSTDWSEIELFHVYEKPGIGLCAYWRPVEKIGDEWSTQTLCATFTLE